MLGAVFLYQAKFLLLQRENEECHEYQLYVYGVTTALAISLHQQPVL